jgi:MFS family permease
MIVTGILVTYALGAVLVDNGLWPWVSIACSAVATVFAVLIARMPESPAFLLKHGCDEEAREVLVYLRGGGDYDVDPELNDIRRQDEEAKRSGKVRLSDLGAAALFKPLLVSIGLMFNQQFCGMLMG